MNSPHATLARRSCRSSKMILALLALGLLSAATLRLNVGQTFGWPNGNLLHSLAKIFLLAQNSTSATPDALSTTSSSTMDIRLLRVVLAIIVGGSLAYAGVALQSLLRNPLAEPFILGLSSGSAVGIMAQWLIVFSLQQPIGDSQTGAILGAAISALIVYLVGQKKGLIDPLGLLLTGVILSTIHGAILMLLNYLSTPAGMREDLGRWMMGYLHESVSPHTVPITACLAALGLILLFRQGPAMDVAGFSDAEAQSIGVNLPRLRTILFLTASLAAAIAVVLAGPIGFVGLLCPHLARLLLGPSHRNLLLGASLLGATLVLLADTLATLLDYWLDIGIMPIGVFTAILGGPVFLWMLRPQLGRGQE